MTRLLSLRTAFLVLIAASVAACNDQSAVVEPTAEVQQPAHLKVPSAELYVLQRNGPTSTAHTSAVVDATGGTLSVGGVELVIPAGALTAPTRISMTVPEGAAHQVRFAPHGLKFNTPATLRVDLTGTDAASDPDFAASLVGVYFNGKLGGGGLVSALELFQVTLSDGHAEHAVPHFSGYTMASDRRPKR